MFTHVKLLVQRPAVDMGEKHPQASDRKIYPKNPLNQQQPQQQNVPRVEDSEHPHQQKQSNQTEFQESRNEDKAPKGLDKDKPQQEVEQPLQQQNVQQVGDSGHLRLQKQTNQTEFEQPKNDDKAQKGIDKDKPQQEVEQPQQQQNVQQVGDSGHLHQQKQTDQTEFKQPRNEDKPEKGVDKDQHKQIAEQPHDNKDKLHLESTTKQPRQLEPDLHSDQQNKHLGKDESQQIPWLQQQQNIQRDSEHPHQQKQGNQRQLQEIVEQRHDKDKLHVVSVTEQPRQQEQDLHFQHWKRDNRRADNDQQPWIAEHQQQNRQHVGDSEHHQWKQGGDQTRFQQIVGQQRADKGRSHLRDDEATGRPKQVQQGGRQPRRVLRLAEHPDCVDDVHKYCKRSTVTNFAVVECLQDDVKVGSSSLLSMSSFTAFRICHNVAVKFICLKACVINVCLVHSSCQWPQHHGACLMTFTIRVYCLIIVCLICLCTTCTFSTLILLVGSFDL